MPSNVLPTVSVMGSLINTYVLIIPSESFRNAPFIVNIYKLFMNHYPAEYQNPY